MSEQLTLEDILKRDGVLIYKTRGASMRPMLKQNRDLVTVRPTSGRLKKYDIPLYRRRGGGYVLHRIIKVTENGYVIRGDNTFVKELNVTDGDIIGVLTGFRRKGKDYSVQSAGFKLYSRVWNFIYPLRLAAHKTRRLAGKLKRKVKGGA